jgi:hypothetical protein
LNAPGLFLAGHFRDGISLSDSIISGERAAERLHSFVAGRALTDRLHRQKHAQEPDLPLPVEGRGRRNASVATQATESMTGL